MFTLIWCDAGLWGSEPEALRHAVKCILHSYSEEFPKQKEWKQQLERVCDALADGTCL